MPKSDGSVVIDTKIDTKGFRDGVADSEKILGGIASSAKKIAAIVGSAFAVGKLVDFGREAVELGSDLSEVQNVVDVTFEHLSEDVNQFAKNAITKFGLSETSAKQYASTMGAMLKSMGFTIDEAKDMGTTLAGLAGDLASFYNLSGDDAFAKIRAGISGETEPLKQLGINLSVANLEQYALSQGITKSYSAMTQQEAALLRYNYLLSVTSDAQGDFARTSDGWANQTRILSENFNSLKATLGQGLINVFSPVIKLLNELIGKLSGAADAFRSFTASVMGSQSGAAASANSTLAGSYDDVTEAVETAGEAQKGFLTGLDEIHTFDDGEDEITAPGISGTIGGSFNLDVQGGEKVQTIVDEVNESLQKMLSILAPIKAAWSEFGDKIKAAFANIGADISRMFSEIGASTTNWLSSLDWTPLFSSVSSATSAIEPLIDDITTGLSWAYENVLLPFGTWTLEELVPVIIDDFAATINGFTGAVEALQPLGDWLWEKLLKPIGEWTGSIIIDALTKLGDIIGKLNDEILPPFRDLVDGLVDQLNELIDGNVGFGEFLDNLSFGETILLALAVAIGVVTAAVVAWNVVAGIATVVTGGLATVVGLLTSPIALAVAAIAGLIAIGVLLYQNWDEIKAAASKIWEQIKDIFGKAVAWTGNLFKKDWTESCGYFGNVLNGLFKSASDIVASIKRIFSGIIDFFTGVFKGDWKKAWNGIKDIIGGVWDAIVGVVKAPINLIIGFINGMLQGIADGVNTVINAVNKMSFDVPDWVPVIGGETFGFNLPKMNAAQIPYLAKGAVIPPNAPFAAVLGDQRHGTNVEAPLETIKDAVRGVLRESTFGGNATYTFIGQIDRRTLFEEMMTEAELRRGRTGRNPFEMA